MKNNRTFRGGFGLAQIMALLLVVLPTVAFIVTLLIDYWAVMRIDNNLKLMTNLATSKMNNITDLSVSPSDAALETLLSSFCPNNKTVSLGGSRIGDGSAEGIITVNASYTHNGTYLKNKTMTSTMVTYSYHDQNATINLVCN
ncbi:MAG: hypothetical protein FP820_08560 [Sulfurimonas sp.]|nr:hypothetical protein [Sulfurimonas sp.]MBU3939291.1 hypothetical protein [bacterium]MBU4024110.1 hypothetical protein [bacterium]MBU4058466.1 hypothetical protein [bacterium]MBU4109671.1 hypothetical protein [bacterium]